MKSLLLTIMAASATAMPAQAAPDGFDAATRTVLEMARASRAVPSASPALSVVMVEAGRAPVVYVDGVADVRTGAAADAETPFYIASMTKAYVGLLAATLDQRGMFDLDQTMVDVWPELKLEGRDPAAITFRQLLSHQAAIENDELTGLTAYVRDVPASDYEAILERTEAREPGFQYDNLGYLIYGAALELKTGRHWRTWLDQVVLQPLGMTHTATRTSGFDVPVAAAHPWAGDGQWDTRTVKSDGLMHAAGGLMTSTDDMGRWLSANMVEQAASIPHAAFVEAHTQLVAVEADQEGVVCQGYALGWRVCDLEGRRILLHGGGYAGARSLMAIAPDLKAGVAVMTNTDAMTGNLGGRLVRAFFETLARPDQPSATATGFLGDFTALVERQLAARQGRVAKARAEPVWQGWVWRPDAAALDEYAGHYRSELGDLVIVRDEDGLHARLGDLSGRLQPAATDLFGIQDMPLEAPDQARFIREGGRVVRFDWDGDLYERVD